MTSQSPRIYTYKITFEEVPYYYYGVHKERKYNEYYMGTPVTHKWAWELYTPKIQILQIFEFSDEGYLEAQEVEKRLIKPFYQVDKWCLNENCGGKISLNVLRAAGKMIGNKLKDEKRGIFGLSEEQKRENGKKAGKISGIKSKNLGIGIFSLTLDEMLKNSSMGGKIGGKKSKLLGLGIHKLSHEERIEAGKLGGTKSKELGVGVHSFTREQRQEIAKNTNSQKWMCLETGFVTTPGPLTRYQNKRDIDTSKRKRVG